jgi:hypothetical protein
MMDRRAMLGFLATAAGSLQASRSALQAGNAYRLSDGQGGAELEWLSSSSFRLVQRWQPQAGTRKPIRSDKVPVTLRVEGDSLQFTTRYLRVIVQRKPLRLKVYDAAGKLLLEDIAGPRREHSRVVWERGRQESEKFWGLGPGAGLDGQERQTGIVETGVPFLMSSLGYGEYFRPAGFHRYVFGQRRRVETPVGAENEFCFYYGPTPKEILEEHLAVERPPGKVDWETFRLARRPPRGTWTLPNPGLDWDGLAELIRRLLRCSYSAILLPGVDLAAWRTAGAQIRRRASQLAVYVPVVYDSAPDTDAEGAVVARKRARWASFLASYGYEMQERGFPLVRPLGMQYPRDAQAVACDDAFMLGDELLVAPVGFDAEERSLYLPAGQWTEWHTNARYEGRRAIKLVAEPGWMPLFVKNGSIVPVVEEAGARRVAAHYYPRPAGEFFFYEEGSGALTQLHAAPAGELLRLQIEPEEERVWEWVVHHVPRPSRATAGGTELRPAQAREALRPGQWWYDESQANLHLQVQPPAGSDHVVYVTF